MKRNGAELIVEALKKEGVSVIFGYPGGAVIPFFDVLYSEKEIRVVLTRHVQTVSPGLQGKPASAS